MTRSHWAYDLELTHTIIWKIGKIDEDHTSGAIKSLTTVNVVSQQPFMTIPSLNVPTEISEPPEKHEISVMEARLDSEK